MEDLRTDEQKKIDENLYQPSRNTSMYTGHIPSFWTIIKKLIKKFIKPIFIIGIILLFLLYPNEIGLFIGNWIFEFCNGITNNF